MKNIIQKISQHLSQGDAVIAEKQLRSAISTYGNNEDLLALLGHSLMMQKKNR